MCSRIILIFVFFITSCTSRTNNMNDFVKHVREDFSKQAKEANEQTFIWESKIDKIYFLSEKNYDLGISYIDSLLKYDNSVDSFKITELQNNSR